MEFTRNGPPFQITVEELRERTIRSFMDSWISADLSDELERAVSEAKTVAEIVEAINV